MHSQPSEKLTIAGIAGPQTIANTAVLSSALDMSKFEEALFLLCLGDMAAETIDFKLQASATSGGTYADIPAKAITQLAASATANDNKQVLINLKAEKMPTGTQFVKASAITGGATGGSACILALGLRPRFGPASDDKLASVVQTVI